jgi:glycosyltransferase involved in cell wall biosynthesis
VPFDAGDRIYTAELAGSLAAAGTDVTFLGLAAEGSADLTKLSPNVRWQHIDAKQASPVRFLLKKQPMSAIRHRVKPFIEAITSAIRTASWDVVIIDYYSMGWALEVMRKAGYSGPVAYIAHNFETEVSQSIAKAYRGNRLKRMMLTINSKRIADCEATVVRKADLIVALTDRDLSHLGTIGSAARMIIIPPGYSGPRVSDRVIDHSVPRRAIAVGSFEWTAKQINLVKFLALADKRFRKAGIELYIVGKIPPTLRTSLEGQLTATKLVGFVDDLSKEFSSSRVALVFDETGGGFKLKMLDYVYSRVPICGLQHALEGLPEGVLNNVVATNDMPQLIEAVVSVIDDVERLDRLQNGAFQEIEHAFSWDANGKFLLSSLSAICGGPRPDKTPD